jgi:hypothetical protein
MKDWLKRILVTALCITLVISMVRIQNLKEELERETRNLQSQIQSMESRMNSIYNNVDEMLEKEASLLTFNAWKIKSIDVEKETAMVDISIIPKEYQAGMTEAVLQVGSQEYPMIMEDGQYRAEIETALFDSCEIEAVVLRDSTYTRTEYLGWSIHPRYDMLPDVSAHMTGSWSFGPKGKSYNTLSCDGDIRVRIEGKEDVAAVQSVHLLTVLDGKVQDRTAIPSDEYGEYTIACKESYEVPFGSRFEMVVEMVDKHGLVYRNTVERWSSDKTGQSIDDTMDWLGRSAAIYNKEGKLLFMD